MLELPIVTKVVVEKIDGLWQANLSETRGVHRSQVIVPLLARTRRGARKQGRVIAKYVESLQPTHPFEFVTRNRDGTFSEPDTFGYDPEESEG